MQKTFRDRNGNPLERGVLYDLPPLAWPLSFQSYESRHEGDFDVLEAVFWDFKGNPHYFGEKKVAVLATKTTPEKAREYVIAAHSLVDWLSTKASQSQPKCTEQTPLRRIDLMEPGYSEADD
jgi:hypothetical protein